MLFTKRYIQPRGGTNMYSKFYRRTFWVCLLFSVQLGHSHSSGKELYHQSLICCPQGGKAAVGCATDPWMLCSLTECQCQQEHQISVWFNHQITLSASIIFYFFSIGGKYSLASFNSTGALSLSFHSGNESWPFCVFVVQKQTVQYLLLTHKTNK